MYKLTPLIDEDGLPFDLQFPVILLDDHRITKLIVQYYHGRVATDTAKQRSTSCDSYRCT